METEHLDPPALPGTGPAERDRAKWPFRIGGAVALLLAVWFCAYAFGRSPDHADTSPVDDPAILQQLPSPGSHVLRQTQVGVLLKPGYDGRITVNGTPIPEDQMDGALDPSDAAATKYGVRPNNKNQVFFTPAAGKVITRYSTGEVNVTVRFWPIELGSTHARTVSWAVFVT